MRCAIDVALVDFSMARSRSAAEQDLPVEVIETLRGFLEAGGKRLRPVLCVVGWHAAGGEEIPAAVLRVAASLEMFHAFALIHDDVMDGSDTRRGRLTVHRTAATLHRDGRSHAAADRLGAAIAVLVGDLALAWSVELLHSAGLDPAQLARVLPLTDAMRTETMWGQYLDVTMAGRPTADFDQALRIARYKTARYTFEWPLRIGAALAGAEARVCDALSAYARPLGEAFQLRDDLLGVFGSPALTGKPDLDDLRDGKHTALVAVALQRADPVQRRLLRSLLGKADLDEHGAAQIRDVLVATGARDAVEQLITARLDRALRAVDQPPFPIAATAALRQLANAATVRTA
ncbi:polyprenyl synthetase family protein [Streptomyces sp. NPDC057743]|uniref:polyprenyl synthetase family protein n=1 Tax=Streptomyces sp. NPDC057743 TaxID=3346236 RepID=UPI00367D9CC3